MTQKTKALDTLIVYCHPYEKSFTHAVLEAIEEGLDDAGRAHETIDLYADGFECAMSAEELSVYGRGLVLDPLVKRYQDLVGACRHLVIVCPVWWNDVPSMVRGWIDKVMLVGFSWEATGAGLVGTLTSIEDVRVYSTSTNSTDYTRERLGNAIEAGLINGTFWQLGVGSGVWRNLGGIDFTSPAERNAWLAEVRSDFAG